MVRSDEFFNFLIRLEEGFPEKPENNYKTSNYCIRQAVLNSFNHKHSLPMERVDTLSLEKAKDVYLEYFYLPVKSVVIPEIHFNLIDVFYNSGRKIYETMLSELEDNFTVSQLYDWRLKYYNTVLGASFKVNYGLERLSKIKAYFKYR